MPTLPLIPKEKKWKMFFIGVSIFVASYFGTAVLGKPRATTLEFTWLDHQVPFLGWTIWFYISHYLIIPTAYVLLKKSENYSAMFYSMLMTIGASCMIFLFYPTCINRPEDLTSSLIDTVRWLLYQVDSPTNCFPSLHVALAVLASIYVMQEYKLLGALFWLWSLLIILSTVTLKQHYAIDVLGGIVVASLAHSLTLILIRGNLKPYGPRAI